MKIENAAVTSSRELLGWSARGIKAGDCGTLCSTILLRSQPSTHNKKERERKKEKQQQWQLPSNSWQLFSAWPHSVSECLCNT